MKKPAIPPTTGADPRAVLRTVVAMRENVEVLTGRRGGKIERLPSGATLADLVVKVNEILDRMQD